MSSKQFVATVAAMVVAGVISRLIIIRITEGVDNEG